MIQRLIHEYTGWAEFDISGTDGLGADIALLRVFGVDSSGSAFVLVVFQAAIGGSSSVGGSDG